MNDFTFHGIMTKRWNWNDEPPVFPGVVTDRMKAHDPNVVAGIECECLTGTEDSALVVYLTKGKNNRWFIGGSSICLEDGIAYDGWYCFDEELTEREIEYGFALKGEALNRAEEAWRAAFSDNKQPFRSCKVTQLIKSSGFKKDADNGRWYNDDGLSAYFCQLAAGDFFLELAFWKGSELLSFSVDVTKTNFNEVTNLVSQSSEDLKAFIEAISRQNGDANRI